MTERPYRTLAILMMVFGVASLVHFTHNAEYLSDYPNLPRSWTRVDVYGAWLLMTAIGIAGWLTLARGHAFAGLLLIAAYASLGVDSLGHYVVAPLAAHSPAMNATILLEVAAAALVFVEAARIGLARLFAMRRAARRTRA